MTSSIFQAPRLFSREFWFSFPSVLALVFGGTILINAIANRSTGWLLVVTVVGGAMLLAGVVAQGFDSHQIARAGWLLGLLGLIIIIAAIRQQVPGNNAGGLGLRWLLNAIQFYCGMVTFNLCRQSQRRRNRLGSQLVS